MSTTSVPSQTVHVPISDMSPSTDNTAAPPYIKSVESDEDSSSDMDSDMDEEVQNKTPSDYKQCLLQNTA